MNWIDLVFIAAIVLSVAYSFARGMIREFFALLALAAGVFLGLKAAPTGVQALSPQLASPVVAAMITFLVTFVVAALLLLFVGSLLAHAVQTVKLGWADRLLGAAFGFGKGILLVLVVILLMAGFQSTGNSALRRSRVAAAVSGLAVRACGLLPPEAANTLRQRFEEIKTGAPGARTEALSGRYDFGGEAL
jgi:membrane protein required for colicin V production